MIEIGGQNQGEQGLAGPSASSGDANIGIVEPAVYVAAGLSLAAASIHLWAMPEHFGQWWGYGVFYLACLLTQGLLAIALLRWPERAMISLAGIWGNLAIIAVYVLTRTYGVPVGPHAGAIEDAGYLDMAATVAEFGVIVALVALLGGATRRWMLNILLLLGVTVWVLRLTGILP